MLSKKYSKLPGIQKLRHFVYVKPPVTSAVVARVRELFNTGPFSISTSHVQRGVDEHSNAFPDLQTQNYEYLRQTRALTDSKQSILVKCSRISSHPKDGLPFYLSKKNELKCTHNKIFGIFSLFLTHFLYLAYYKNIFKKSLYGVILCLSH